MQDQDERDRHEPSHLLREVRSESGRWRKRIKIAAVAFSIIGSLVGGATAGAEYDDYFDTNVCEDD